ncbi:unnamed protein product, partial [Urochloa humidicola]
SLLPRFVLDPSVPSTPTNPPPLDRPLLTVTNRDSSIHHLMGAEPERDGEEQRRPSSPLASAEQHQQQYQFVGRSSSSVLRDAARWRKLGQAAAAARRGGGESLRYVPPLPSPFPSTKEDATATTSLTAGSQ